MPVVDERLSLLEVKMQDVGATLIRIEGTLGTLHQMLAGLDQRVDKLDQRFDRLDQRVDRLDQRIDRLDERFLKLFLWVIGIQMTTFLAIVAGLFGIVTKLI
jgi:predicted nuclease with TOPRIM domain